MPIYNRHHRGPAISTLDVVIVSFNAREDLARCLESLHAHPSSAAQQIVVVDNASTDGSPDLVARLWPDVRLLRHGTNEGFARANNAGIRVSSGELVLLLNSDTLVPAGALDSLLRVMARETRAAVVGPRLVDPAGVAELSFGRMISPWNEARQKLVEALHARGFPPARAHVERVTRRSRWVEWVSGACLLVRRADADAVGLLDERYFMYAEDVDFCAAIRARGRGVLFTPEAEIVHRRGRSRATAPRATGQAYRRSQIAFYAKHHPGWARWLRLYLRLKGALPPDPPGRAVA